MLKVCLFFSMVLTSGPAFCLSDEANPWLALENANCKKHLTLNYRHFLYSFGDVDIDIKVANWKGSSKETSTFCELQGRINSVEKFKILLPMEWSGKSSVYPWTHYATEFFNHDAVYLGDYKGDLVETFFSFVITNHYRKINKPDLTY